ncbi:MAG: TOBE domain-containing protein [Candidatus Eisenbacteria bacterium]|nr:TOBE domain-containing protein [Candidatus Latescibacterota bacterium]MBD3301320.1 TOBE domain-containing protein [Candidatus Eisenbacteria bacterium]
MGVDAPVAGVRPEDVRIDPQGSHPARIALREPLGPQHLLTLEGDGWTARASVPSALRLSEGDPVRVSFAPEKIHRFDENGKRIPPPGREDPKGG